MNVPRTLWLFPAAFLVHDGEEIATMPAWIAANQETLARVADVGPLAARVIANLPRTTAQVGLAVAVELVLIVVVTSAMARSPRQKAWLYLYGMLLGAFSLHALTHVAQAIWFGGYTPGVVSAVLVVPPASLVLYRRLVAAGLLTWPTAAASAGAGLLLLFPTLLAAHAVGRWAR